jgi:hypothetical protein
MSFAHKNDSGSDSRQRFVELSSELTQMAAHEGLKIVPFYNVNLIHFSALRSVEQKHVLEQLETLVFICNQIQEQKERIRSVKSLTWAFLKHFQCTGPSDLLNHMRDDDIVDAYGAGHKMLFAGLTFFEVFSYSLEEFFCRSWMELFVRDASVQETLFELCGAMLRGEHTKVVSTQFIPSYRCDERSSSQQISVMVEPQFFAPLFKKGEIIGYLCSNRGSILEPQKH